MGLLLDSKTTRVLRETLGLTLCVKPIVSPNRTSVNTLVVLYCLSHYKFKERLINKAKEMNV